MEPITRRTMLVAAGSAALSSQAVAEVEKYPRNLTQQDVDRWMTELSNWGKWGKDDQAGTINLITPAKRKAAAALVREGVSVSMSLDADLPKQGSTAGPLPGMMGGVANRATWTLTSRPPGPDPRDLAAYVVDTIAVSYHGNNTTHLDAPSHLYYKGRIYNGYPQSGYSDRGAGKDDVMSMKNGILTRGVLFDMPKLKGVSYLGDDEPIYVEDLEAWEKQAGFRVETGDAVLVRTGRWVRVREKGPLDLNRATPGLYASCVKWLRERGAAILGSDVVQDVRPSRVEGVNQPIHQMALRALGMPLIDNADLEALSEAAAQRRRWTYLLTMNPLRVPGATGGPVNPIATF
ncbi:MAG: cyclase family protein [Bryobacteraceae bacterium]|jgi:kynurenine formamidase